MGEMRLDNGRYVTAPVSQFSEEDQNYLRERYKKENAVVYNKDSSVDMSCFSNASTKHEKYGYTRVTVQPRVIFNN